MNANEKIFDAIIVGAGLSGLVLAKKLSMNGQNLCILEKSRSVGGRMATRRDGEATYDHGAQFYKLRQGQASKLEQLLTPKDILQTWFQKNDDQYLVAPRGITTIAKQLSQNLNIYFNEKVLNLSLDSKDFIRLDCESGKTYCARRVFISAPLPQSLDLLKNSKISYPKELDEITYAKALVGLFELQSSDSNLVQFSYEEINDGNIFSLSNQQSKKVSEKLAWTVVMNPQWSEKHFEETEDRILQQIQDLFSESLKKKKANFKIVKSQLKKWRYSHPLKIHTVPFESIGEPESIFLMGDAFGGASLNGALNSAIHVFNHFINIKERGYK